MRIKRSGVIGAASIAAIAVTIGTVFAVGNSDGKPSANAKPAPATVSGVEVTWLPTGFSREATATSDTKTGVTTEVQDFRGALPADGYTSAPHLTLNVQRGPGAPKSEFEKIGLAGSDLTIRGHKARLFTAPANSSDASKTEPLYAIEWTERPGLTVSISAFWGATLDHAKGVAAGLVVHDGPG